MMGAVSAGVVFTALVSRATDKRAPDALRVPNLLHVGVSRLGMTYIHIPVDFQNPTDDDFDQFCAVMEQLKEVPVHVHCIANYRVSAFFYRYRRDVLGVGEATARADMEQIWHPEGVWASLSRRSSDSGRKKHVADTTPIMKPK